VQRRIVLIVTVGLLAAACSSTPKVVGPSSSPSQTPTSASPTPTRTLTVPTQSASPSPTAASTVLPTPTTCTEHNGLPDINCTPGATNIAVRENDIKSTICVVGWTKTVRPPESYTEPLKLQQIKQYGYTNTDPRAYEEDHLISLELGGSPTSPLNLWPEPHANPFGSFEKDAVENDLHRAVCDRTITLVQAQTIISGNWETYYTKQGLHSAH
jgi:hypothetical protein